MLRMSFAFVLCEHEMAMYSHTSIDNARSQSQHLCSECVVTSKKVLICYLSMHINEKKSAKMYWLNNVNELDSIQCLWRTHARTSNVNKINIVLWYGLTCATTFAPFGNRIVTSAKKICADNTLSYKFTMCLTLFKFNGHFEQLFVFFSIWMHVRGNVHWAMNGKNIELSRSDGDGDTKWYWHFLHGQYILIEMNRKC